MLKIWYQCWYNLLPNMISNLNYYMDRALWLNFHCTHVRWCGGKLERKQMVSTLIPEKHDMYLLLHKTAFISIILDTTRYVGSKVRCKIDFWIEKSDKQPQDLVSSFPRDSSPCQPKPSLQGFDANNQHRQSLKSHFLTSETDIFFQLLCGWHGITWLFSRKNDDIFHSKWQPPRASKL